MSARLQEKIISIIEDTLNSLAPPAGERVVITPEDSMETVALWDSTNFIPVFLAINEAFNINPDFDDAIHYISFATLYDFLEGQNVSIE